MKILFDCRYTRIDRHDGISRYTTGLVTELARLHPVTMLISDHRQRAMLPDLPWELISSPTSIREPFVARHVNRLEPDVVFTPMQTMGSWGRTYRLAVTLHDLIYYTNRTPPVEFSWPIRVIWRLFHSAWWPQRAILNAADVVVTVSNTTKNLISQHDLTRKPVEVVPNAALPVPSTDSSSGVAPRARPATKRLVYMGSFAHHKNVETLVRTLAYLPDYELHLMSTITREVRALLDSLVPDARVIFHNGVSDDQYCALLRESTALVSSSRDEGFGIPLIEAMAVGTPVVVSDIPIFREIGQSAASYADPDDPATFAQAIRDLEKEGEWEARSIASAARAADFSWKQSARALLDVLTRLHGAPGARDKGIPPSRVSVGR